MAFLLWLPDGISAVHYLQMAMLVFAGACLQGIGGVGFAVLCAPVALLWFPQLVPGPLLAMGGLVSLLTALREFGAIAWTSAGSALLGRFGGSVVAVSTMTLLRPDVLSVLFALCILAAVMLSAFGWHVRPTHRTLVVAGAASGFMGTITSAGSQPFAIAMQHLPPARLRATIGCILFTGAVASIVLLAAADRFGALELRLSMLLAPALLLGFLVSNRLRHRFAAAAVRRLLLGLCTAGALAILLRVGLGL